MKLINAAAPCVFVAGLILYVQGDGWVRWVGLIMWCLAIGWISAAATND